MPPRKSDASRKSDVTTARFEPVSEEPPEVPPAASSPPPSHGGGERKGGPSDAKDGVSIDDLNLPKSIITRLAKGVLPENTQIQTNATLALRQSATVFINYLAAQANEHTQSVGKKTILPHEVFKALDDIEFGFMRPALEAEFKKYAEIQSSKRTSYRKKVAAAKRAAVGTATGSEGADGGEGGEQDGSASPGDDAAAGGSLAKKPRLSGGVAGDEEEVDDAETEPEDEVEDDDEDEDDDVEEDEEDDEDEGANDDDEMEDTLEEREQRVDDDDEVDDSD